jgi:hypothetical protein
MEKSAPNFPDFEGIFFSNHQNFMNKLQQRFKNIEGFIYFPTFISSM